MAKRFADLLERWQGEAEYDPSFSGHDKGCRGDCDGGGDLIMQLDELGCAGHRAGAEEGMYTAFCFRLRDQHKIHSDTNLGRLTTSFCNLAAMVSRSISAAS